MARRLLLALLLVLAAGPFEGRAQSTTTAQTLDGPRAGDEAGTLHRELLALAEQELARGSLAEGLAAADEAIRLAEQMGDSRRGLAARAVEGHLLAASGEDERALRVLEAVVAEAPALGLAELAAAAAIPLAQVELARGDRAAARERLRQVEEDPASQAFPDLRLIAGLDRLRLEVADPEPRLDPARAEGLERALVAQPDSPRVGLRLVHLGRSFVLAAERRIEPRAPLFAAADRVLRRALAVADALPDDAPARRVRAEALGTLGALHAEAGRAPEALALTQRALRLAARSELEIDAYAWHVQAAELHARLGDRDRALEAGARAIEIAERHRPALTRQAIVDGSPGPAALLRRQVDRLLQRARSARDRAARETDLRRAQATLERLKSEELRDYFEDDCVARARAKSVAIEEAAPEAIVLYPFVLDDRLELLVSAAGALEQIVVDVPREALEAEVATFRVLLEKRTTQQYLRSARILHRALVEPLSAILADHPEATLVFVPDGILRTIPMAALHDGERFLIERRPVATTPGLELTDPRPFSRDDPSALLVGLSVASGGFERLENVAAEIRGIREITGGDVLLDEAFSPAALTQKLEAKPYRLLHVASHAAFDDGREGGFLQTAAGRLAFSDLSAAIGAGRLREDPLELVVLSACETAVGGEGGERAALGLSGMAVRAGARSAIGSLWRVHDEATARFMATFYRTLAEPGRSRAEAVRAAQQALLADPAYRHPYFWSPFLLISSWL
jgi:CHAT domain-containing protein